jgi:hypothetical protein
MAAGLMPNPLSKFGLTDEELDAEMARNPEVIKGLQELGDQVRDYWKALAPVFDEERDRRKTPGIGEEGDYRDSIHTEAVRRKDGKPGMRVGTNDPKAIWIEVGTAHMPEYAPATKTAHYFHDTTGPTFSEGVQQAQGNLREALETLAKAKATGTSAEVKSAKSAVSRARGERSAAFKASRKRGRGR